VSPHRPALLTQYYQTSEERIYFSTGKFQDRHFAQECLPIPFRSDSQRLDSFGSDSPRYTAFPEEWPLLVQGGKFPEAPLQNRLPERASRIACLVRT
jgi:hypothetical protein